MKSVVVPHPEHGDVKQDSDGNSGTSEGKSPDAAAVEKDVWLNHTGYLVGLIAVIGRLDQKSNNGAIDGTDGKDFPQRMQQQSSIPMEG
jgi:hypothetical protein